MKITKDQILTFLKDKNYFIDGDTIYFIEWEDDDKNQQSGIAYKFDKYGYLIDVYTWNDYDQILGINEKDNL